MTSLIITPAFSQENDALSPRSFHSLGYSVYTDFVSTPRTIYSYWDPNAVIGYTTAGNPITGKTISKVNQDYGFSYFTFFYRYRYNLKEYNDNRSLGISVTPALGLSLSWEEGVGYFNLPIQLELAFGAGSTYNSTSEKGGYIGAGLEINKFPLFYPGGSWENGPQTLWMQPVLSTGLRYWNRKNKVKEINLKFGFSVSNDPVPALADNGSNFGKMQLPPITARISWISFLNY